MRFEHLDLNVSDLRTSLNFYSQVLAPLGYAPAEEGLGWQVLRGPEDYLCLVQVEAPYLEPDFHRKRIGVNHLAFRVRTRADFEAFLAHLAQLRVPLLYGGPLETEGSLACYFEDPDRLKLEVVWRP